MSTKKFVEFVNEAYMSVAHAKQIRDELKKTFPDFKFSIRNENYSSINIAILSGPIKLTDKENGYDQVNNYYIKDIYKDKPEVAEFLSKVNDIANKGNHDDSDTMIDYHDVGWYVHITIGQWDKPYVYIPPSGENPEKPAKSKLAPKYVRQELQEDIEIKPYKNGYVIFGLGTVKLKDNIKQLNAYWNKFLTNPQSGERFAGWFIPKWNLEGAKNLTGAEVTEW